jgi:predicted DNA-binding WGR domain protein
MSMLDEVILNWTDLTGKKTGATALGSNKFYKAELSAVGKGFQVVFTYGRVGQAGQTQTVKATTLEQAKKELDKKIASKIAKGYTRVDLRSGGTGPSAGPSKSAGKAQAATKKAAKKVAHKSSGKFHPEVEDLLGLLYGSTGRAVASGLSASAGATADAPLGNLSDAQLDKGADILEQIEAALKKTSKPKKNVLVDLTNDYLSVIPRRIDHARRGSTLDLDLILVNSAERIAQQRTFITLLRDAFLQKDVFAAAAEVTDPHVVWYEGIQCDITFLDPKSEERKHIQHLFETGQSPVNSNFFGKVKLGRVWSVEQRGRKPAFDAYAKKVTTNKRASGVIAGWHGTRTENLMGICKTGLLMPKNLPKGVHVTGRAFGLGIYHTPCWPDAGKSIKDEKGKSFVRYNGALKSLNYSSLRGAHYHQDNTDARGYMFLEDLALGVPELALKACFDKPSPAKGAHYIYARAHGHKSLANDEVVTFDENASRRAAIVEVLRR